MKKLFTFFLSLLLITTNSYAEYKTLLCVDEDKITSEIISFDEKIQKVKINGIEYQSLIDENQISWKEIFKGGIYVSHKILRFNGRYYISNQNNQLLANYICEVKKQKF
jgi:hypothetical protein